MNPGFLRRFRRLHTADPRADVSEEFTFHLGERIDAFMVQGMSEAEAREAAMRQFGDMRAATSQCVEIGNRRARRVRWREYVESIGQDWAHAFKAMRRAPAFTAVAAATIAIGVGANTAVFSMLNAALLRPLDARNPRELARIYTSEGRAARSDADRFGGSSYADYVDLRRSPTLAGLAAYMPLGVTAQVNGAPFRLEARVVSEDYFTVLGRPPMLGGFTLNESATLEVVVSHHFWATTLASDPGVIGRAVLVNGRSAVVAGVTAPSFKAIEPSNVDLYIPFRSGAVLTGSPALLTDRNQRFVRLIGRLAPGASVASAEQGLGLIMSTLARDYPASNAERQVSARPASSIVPTELVGKGMISATGLVFAATFVMLGVSGVNVAAVLLARTMRRRRELAVRRSLGAGSARIARQLLTESVALATVAGVAVSGVVLLLPGLAAAIGVPASVRPSANIVVLGYAVAVAVGCGVLFGLAPAFVGIPADVVAALRSAGDAQPGRARAQRFLVGAQLALSMLLLIVGGALLRSLGLQQRVDPGFAVAGLIVADFEDPTGAGNGERQRAFQSVAIERLRAIPGVASVSMTTMPPLTSDGARGTIAIPGYVARVDEDMEVPMAIAGPDFFKTLRVPLRAGRELTWGDAADTLSRVVINQSMARRYWGARDPVGSFVRLGGAGGREAEVIGVVADARFVSLAEAPQPMYVVQRPVGGGTSVLIRTNGDAAGQLLAIRAAMSQGDVPLTLVRARAMEEILQGSLGVARVVSDILMAIGVVAVLLAATGLYGVVSYVMSGRTREFAVRVALGARRWSIARLVLGYGMRLAVIGGAVGTLLGVGAVRLMSGMLAASWGAAPVILAVAVFLGVVTLLASALPALHATAVSPAVALKSE